MFFGLIAFITGAALVDGLNDLKSLPDLLLIEAVVATLIGLTAETVNKEVWIPSMVF